MPTRALLPELFLSASILLTLGRAEAAQVLVTDSGDTLHNSPGQCALTGTGTCTLRDAITFANANAGHDDITFQNVTTVSVGVGGLPSITEAVTIDGDLGAGQAVMVDGSGAGAVDGLTISGDGSLIGALQIVSFGGSGIRIEGDGNTIGGCGGFGCGRGRVVLQGNGMHGVLIAGGSNNVVRYISSLQNGGDGVRLSNGAAHNTLGATGFPDSFITVNSGAGVRIGDTVGDVAALGNTITAPVRIYDNSGLGIDLGGDGVTANDAQDGDTGPNGLQNYPVITSAILGPGNVQVAGSLNSVPDTAFTIWLYANGEGKTILGSLDVQTDAQGDATFSTVFPVDLPAGSSLTATATGPDGTSEFSQAVTGTPLPGADFYTVPPCRVLDTRSAPGPYGGPALASDEIRTVSFAGQCGIPGDAQAVSLNVTAVHPTGTGFLRLFPSQSAEQFSSSALNFNPGQTRANNGVIALFSGSLNIRAFVSPSETGFVDVIVDVNGYFK